MNYKELQTELRILFVTIYILDIIFITIISFKYHI